MAVIKRGDKWYITYRVKETGKTIQRMEVVGTRKDLAEAKLKKYKELIRQGIDPNPKVQPTSEKSTPPPAPNPEEVLTLEQFVPIFLDYHGAKNSDSMKESYQSSLGHLLPVFGKMRLDQITKMTVEAYMAKRLKEKVTPYEKRKRPLRAESAKPSEQTRRKRKESDSTLKKKELGFVTKATVNREVVCLKGMLTKALEWEYIPKHPLFRFKLLKEAPIKDRYLTREDAQRLIDASPDYLRDIIVLALGTGMRKSEIFGLKWKDVKFDSERKSGIITVIGKGEKKRDIRMNQTVHNLLARKRREQKGVFVFESFRNEGCKMDNVQHSFESALEKAGITDFRFHDLRHTAASWMVQGGADIYAVQKVLGHSDLKTTQRYAHHSPEYLERQIGILDGFLNPKSDSGKEPPSESALK